MRIRRGDVIVANFEPVVGSEQGGIRPALVIQNDLGNFNSPTVIVTAITSKRFTKNFPTNVFISKKDSRLPKDSTIMLNQIRTIDKKRIIKKLGFLDRELIKKIDLAVKISLDLN